MREWAVCLKPRPQSADSSKTTTEVQQNSKRHNFAKTVKFSQLTHNEHCKLEADSPSTDSAAPAKTGFNGNPVKDKKQSYENAIRATLRRQALRRSSSNGIP